MKNKSFYKKLLYLLGDGKTQLPKLIIFVLLLSFLDLAGIGLIAPYLSIILQPDTFQESYSGLGFNSFNFESSENITIILGLTLILIFIVKAIGGIFLNKLILNFCYSQGVSLRSFLMQAYQALPYEEFLERNSTEYIYHMQVLVEQYYKQILQSILRIGSEGLVIMLISLLLMWVNFFAFLLLFVLMSVSLFIYDFGFRGQLNTFGEQSNIHSLEMARGIKEGMIGIKEIRVLGREEYFFSLVEMGAINYKLVNVRSQVIAAAPRYFLELIIITFIVLISLFSIVIGSNIDSLVPMLGMFGVASIRALPSINQIIGGIVQVRYGKNAIDLLYSDVKNLNNTKPFIKDKLSELPTFQSLELCNISYAYKNSKINTLSNINLSIKLGESVGIIGQSGSGKTTLIDIILGILIPQKGSILFNNTEIPQHQNEWISKVAYIPQQVFLVDDSLSRNITLTLDDSKIDQQKLSDSIQKARLSSLLEQLPDGINTKLGDNGIRISGGQRQRVALARAFYHDREILIMDESTSSLDKNTEQEIVSEIKSLKGKITMIIISHSISTIEHCDKVYRIEDGHLELSN